MESVVLKLGVGVYPTRLVYVSYAVSVWSLGREHVLMGRDFLTERDVSLPAQLDALFLFLAHGGGGRCLGRGGALCRCFSPVSEKRGGSSP